MISFPEKKKYTSIVSNEQKLCTIKSNCDNSHKHCYEIVQKANNFHELITQEYFNEFIILISNFNVSCCLSTYYNKKSSEIIKFILSNSKKFKINKLDNLIQFIPDIELKELIINQESLDPQFIKKFMKLEVINYHCKMNVLNLLNGTYNKLITFEYIIMLMTLDDFSIYLDKINKNFSQSVDNIILKFILKNKINLLEKNNVGIGIKILNTFITKSNIVYNIYPLISENINPEQKKDIFNKNICSYDKKLIFLMLEKKDIIPDINTINKLVEKSYPKTDGASNCKQIAEIIDLLYEYGLIINKQIIIKLLDHGCYVNNLEKHDILVDNVILEKCAHQNFYPYKFDIIPNTDILIKECSKKDNINTIKKLKEFGGIYTQVCLEEACKLPRNGKVIKYLITECGVTISDKSLDNFLEAYKIDSFDLLIKKYKLQNPNIISDDKLDSEKNIEINNNSLMTITPRNIEFDIKNKTIEYIIKNKIRKFFDWKKKTIKYYELYELVLRYLIINKLVIGKYFVINTELSNLLKINHCVIMDINQIHNMMTYFIDLPEINLSN